jgi:hypothetical protein
MQPTFDPSINLGSLIALAVIVVGGIKVWAQQKEMLAELARRFHEHEKRDEELFAQMQNRILDLSGGIQRLIGENSVFRIKPRT